jgi:hypothetical protein
MDDWDMVTMGGAFARSVLCDCAVYEENMHGLQSY